MNGALRSRFIRCNTMANNRSVTLKTSASRVLVNIYTPAQRSWWGVYWIHLVRLSVCRRHGFRSVTRVCLGISISDFICMLFVAMVRSLLIVSDVTFKMAAWWPYWIFRFLDSNFILALDIKSKLHWHIICVLGKKPIDFHIHVVWGHGPKPKHFQVCHFINGHLAAILDILVSGCLL